LGEGSVTSPASELHRSSYPVMLHPNFSEYVLYAVL
jgi:hypothetical protein